MMMSVKPYTQAEGSKKEQVTAMFNRIAPKYDFLNHLLSMGIDKLWRKRVVRIVARKKAPVVLDVATGTGDLAIDLAGFQPEATSVYCGDISTGMMERADKKLLRRCLQLSMVLKEAVSEALPLSDRFFDAVTVAFGVR